VPARRPGPEAPIFDAWLLPENSQLSIIYKYCIDGQRLEKRE